MIKKCINYLLTALFAVSMTGCDKDAVEAFILEGTWTGHMEEIYQDRWGTGSYGSFRTTMRFIQRDMYGGTGYEVDYDSYSPYSDYSYTSFTWEVRNGAIYINYANSWTTVRIYDYTLNLYSFRGYMDFGSRTSIYFDLKPDSNFDWDRYYGYARETRSTDGKTFHSTGIFQELEKIRMEKLQGEQPAGK